MEPLTSQRGAGCRFSLDPAHYIPRCKKCHVRFDGQYGEGKPQAKLTDEAVLEIRELWQSTKHLSPKHPDRWTARRLAELFEVSMSTVSHVTNGRRWTHLLEEEDLAGAA